MLKPVNKAAENSENLVCYCTKCDPKDVCTFCDVRDRCYTCDSEWCWPIIGDLD